jgi:hypothetical protein
MDLMGSMQRSDRDGLDTLFELLAQWNRAYGPSVQIRHSDIEWNLVSQDLVTYRVSRLVDVPIVYGCVSDAGRKRGLPENSLWISLWGEIGSGREQTFLTAALDLARFEKKSRLVLGGDEFHFVPGIPLMTPQGVRLADAARAASFEGADASDFVGTAHGKFVDTYIREATESEGLRDFQLLPAETEERLDELDGFLTREFPGRWTREFRFWRMRPDTGRAFWMTLMHSRQDQSPNAIVGFARMAVRGRFLPIDAGWSPGSLRLPLVMSADEIPEWRGCDACLGPIGVANSSRGQGAGKALLGRVLKTLQINHAERVCIDWTNAFRYYEPLHFEKTRNFLTAWKKE